jgi:hypothetical protein
MLGAAAIAELHARASSTEPGGEGCDGSGAPRGAPRPFLAALVQDANCPTASSLDDFEACRPLLLPGAAIVVTLKNFDGNPKKWAEACGAAETKLKRSCSAVQVLHLFRNGPVETTLVGVYRGGETG